MLAEQRALDKFSVHNAVATLTREGNDILAISSARCNWQSKLVTFQIHIPCSNGFKAMSQR